MSTKRTSRFGSSVINNVEKRKSESSGFGYLSLPKGLSMYKEEEGKMKFDIIPYIVTDPHHLDRNADDEFAANVGNPWYKKPIWVHRGVGADKQSVVCPSKTLGKKCPICEAREKQKTQGIDKDDMIKWPQLRNVYVIIPIGHKKYEEKFHIWDIANGNFQEILDQELQEKPENGCFPEPEGGRTLATRFTEKVFGKNKYQEATRVDFEDREDYEDSIMDKAPKIDDMIKVLSYKEIESLFLELGDDDVEEDKPKRKAESEEEGASSFRKRKTVDDVEEVRPRKRSEEKEITDDLPFERPRAKKTVAVEEEEEVVKPRRRPAPVVEEEEQPRKKRQVVVEEEEEEEEEPAPRKKRPAPAPEAEAETPLRRRPAPVVEEEEEEKPVKKKEVAKTEPAGKKKGYECPSEHTFGKDWDEFDSCDDCPLFEACGKANESMSK